MDKDEELILNKYFEKIEGGTLFNERKVYTQDYREFRKEALSGAVSFYESLCLLAGRVIKIKEKEKEDDELRESIETCHLSIKPGDARGFGIVIAGLIILLLVAISGIVFFSGEVDEVYLLMPLALILITLLMIKPLSRMPVYIANKWRLKASNQMVLCVLYMVMHMRDNANLEHAIKFASEHVGNPLALDLKKIFWDVEIGKYSNIKESLDGYLMRWREHNLEFVESLHLIEGSLYEGEENRRIALLEKALDVMLNGTYDKMMGYAQELKNPITMIHMLGVILPILGLVLLPLIGSLMGGSGLVKIILLFLLYNIALPLIVYFAGMKVLAKRPTGYNERNMLENNPGLKKYENVVLGFGRREVIIPAWIICFLIFICISAFGAVPLVMHYAGVEVNFLGSGFLDYKTAGGLKCEYGGGCYGPFGVGAVMLSLFFPLGVAVALGAYYGIKSGRFVKIREETKKLEREFSGGLFQLGSRVGDGVPVERAFYEVANTMEGSAAGGFFRMVSTNIMEAGRSLKEGLFGDDGAMKYYPSSLIESSMKVLLQAARKSPDVVARAMMSISVYMKNIHQVNERLKDLLSEIISSMKSQISFLTPVIAGIVVGISAMIVTILSRLTSVFTETNAGDGFGGGLEGMLNLFEIVNIIPSYYLQLVIGLYVIEIAIVLTILANGIENGEDKISERAGLSKNLYMTGILYFLISVVVTFIFGLLANTVNLTGG